MADLADQIFNGTFDVPAVYKTDEDDAGTVVRAILSENFDPGQESGKGLTKNMRGGEAHFASIVLKVSEVPVRPPSHSIVEEGGETFDIKSSERTRAGTWRCIASGKVRGRRKND